MYMARKKTTSVILHCLIHSVNVWTHKCNRRIYLFYFMKTINVRVGKMRTLVNYINKYRTLIHPSGTSSVLFLKIKYINSCNNNCNITYGKYINLTATVRSTTSIVNILINILV